MVVTLKASFFKELVKLPMEGQKKDGNYYRIKIPNYRIGIQYKYPDVVVIKIVKRNDMYKVFPPGKRK